MLREKLDTLRLLLRKYGVGGLLTLLRTDVWFDYAHGVDTYSEVSKDELFTGDRHALQNRYFPSTFALIELAFAEARAILGDEIRQCNLLDYGSGKGKVLIAGARYGFALSRGIEYTERMHAVAGRNIAKLGLGQQVELIHGDAAEFVPSPKDRVVYLFNPFEGEVLDRAMRNLRSVTPEGKRVLVVYNPICDDIFQRYFTRVAEKVAQPGNARYNVYVG
ncbi:MAG: class I SAM-dependent methyltransferase [Bryobacteraceae bacterium]|nr:class I SAM-dependent methyltransferase [Bryobacteraceae bacterium]